MACVFLALGTNLGNRLENLRLAVKMLPPEIVFRRAASVYETPPWGYLEQPAFLNTVIEVQTELAPQDLLRAVKQIEQDMGRVKLILNGPRSIDLDILLYDQLVLSTVELEIPHPRMRGRAFVLVPLAELCSDWVHPVFERTIAQLQAETDSTGVTVYTGGSEWI